MVLEAFWAMKGGLLVFALWATCTAVCFADFPLTDKLTQAIVMRVVNGDTLDVFVSKFQRELRIQLASADAIEYPGDSQENENLLTTYGVPSETIQSLHQKAVQFLRPLQGMQVTLEDAGQMDKYGRYPVFLWSASQLVNKELLNLGLAVYRPYISSPYDASLSAATVLAQSRKAGLWSYVWSPVNQEQVGAARVQFQTASQARPSGALVDAGLSHTSGTVTSVDEADGYVYLELDSRRSFRTRDAFFSKRIRSLKPGQSVRVNYTVENGKSVLQNLWIEND